MTVQARPPISWQGSIPLVTSRFFQRDVLLALGIASLSGYTLVFLAGLVFTGDAVLLPWEMPVFGFLVMWVLFQLIALGVLGNRADARFTVGAEGMSITAADQIRRVNKAVMLLALLSGRSGTIGSAMLAKSREDTLVPWGSVNHVAFYPRQRVIQIRDSGLRITRLFCPDEQYEAIAERVREELATERTTHPKQPFDWQPVMRRLAVGLGAAVAFVLAMAWAPDDTGALLLTAAATVALAEWFDSWWLGRALGVVSLTTALSAAVVVARLALETTTFEGIITIHGYDHDEPLLVITAVGIAVLAAMAVRRALRPR